MMPNTTYITLATLGEHYSVAARCSNRRSKHFYRDIMLSLILITQEIARFQAVRCYLFINLGRYRKKTINK